MSTASATTSDKDPGRMLIRLIVLAIPIGLLAGIGSALYNIFQHELQYWLWHTLPELLGQEREPWWLVVGLLVVGAVLVALALQLPGNGSDGPLKGFHLTIGPREVASVLLAALASLSFGAVLGPEAPLLALGTAIAIAISRSGQSGPVQVLALAGAGAALGSILGNPLVSGVLLLELLLLSGKVTNPETGIFLLSPLIVALTTGYLLQVGIEDWSGVPDLNLAVPGLPEYTSVQWIDLGVAIPVALVAGLIVVIARRLGGVLADRFEGKQLASLLVGAGVVAAAALLMRAITGESVSLVLFSGQEQMPELLGLAGIGTLVAVVLFKGLAYAASLGAGFRGGPLFPAVFLGVGVGTAAAVLVSSVNLSAMVAAGIAAASAAGLRMPFSSMLLAVLLCAAAGPAVTVLAGVGVVIGLILGLALLPAAAAQEERQERGGGSSTPADRAM